MADDVSVPLGEIYRGIEVWGLQSAKRVEEVKRQIDLVIDENVPAKLYSIACDDDVPAGAPGFWTLEARALARDKCLSARQDRQSLAGVDVDRLNACAGSIERHPCSRLCWIMWQHDAHYRGCRGGDAYWPEGWPG